MSENTIRSSANRIRKSAALSRSMHKTQGFGSAGRRGSQYDNFELVEGEPAAKDLFEGIDTTWNRISGGQRVGKMLQEIQNAFDPRNPSKSVPALIAVYAEMNKLPGDNWVAVKRQELREVIQSCAGLWIEAVSDGFSAAPGEEIPVRITSVNRSANRSGWKKSDARNAVSPPMKFATWPITLRLPSKAPCPSRRRIRFPSRTGSKRRIRKGCLPFPTSG